VTSTLDPIGSCVHSVVPPLLRGEYQVTVPGPGDFERAWLYHFEESGMGFRRFALSVQPGCRPGSRHRPATSPIQAQTGVPQLIPHLAHV